MSMASKLHRLGELMEKSGKMIREKGFRAFFGKFRLYVKKYASRHFALTFEDPEQSFRTQPHSVSEVICHAHGMLQPLSVFRSPDHGRPACLNFVTDALGSYLSGGVGTALILASQYATRRNMTLRIVSRQENANPREYYDFMAMMHEAHPEKVIFWSDCDRDGTGRHEHPLEISDSDVFFTTSWWTTSSVRAADTGCKTFYMIQETEDFFYPSGDMRLWCSWLLNCPDICYIVNSRWLWDYFKVKYPVVCANGTWFEPAFPRFLYQPRQPDAGGKHKLFFHARSNHPRNLYYTGLKVLDEAVMRGIIAPDQWDICFAGDMRDNVELAGGVKPVYLDRMTRDEYARFLGKVDLTFSLMYTPHPGYLFLESLASGCVCVTNSFENKTGCTFCKNAIFRDLSIDALCDGLREGVKLAMDQQARRKNFEEMSLPSDWPDALKETLDFMEHFN